MSTRIVADVTRLGALATSLAGLARQAEALEAELATAVRPALRGDVPELAAIQAGATAARSAIATSSAGLSTRSSAVRAYAGNLARVEALMARYRCTLVLQAFGPTALSPSGSAATVGSRAGGTTRDATRERRAVLAALGLPVPEDGLPGGLAAALGAAATRLSALAASPLGKDALHLARTGEFTRTAQQGFERTYGVGVSGVHRVGRVPVSMSATAQTHLQASASQTITISSKGLAAAAEAGAMATVSAKAQAKAGNRYVGGVVGADVRAEAGAKGDAEVTIGRTGVAAAAHAEVGASVSAGASARGNLSGIGAGAKAEAHAGIMASADFDGAASLDRVKARVELGAAFGVGGSVGFDIDVKPAQVAGDVKDGAGKALDVADKWRKKLDVDVPW